MEQLNHLIKDASNEFECHNFKTSLTLYVRCIEKCQQEQLPTYILHNLKSSEAALRIILGEYETALRIVNEVLQENKQHWLCLLRRSQIYKKQSKYRKAMKDLEMMSMFAPDNMHISALKLEIKGLMRKPNQSSSSQSESEEQVDEQNLLAFSGLKKIDRTSFSIMVPKNRQSRVTLTGDKSFFYEADEEKQENDGRRKSSFYTPHFIRQKVIEIDEELEHQETNQSDIAEAPAIVIKAKNPQRTKSILKNRNSQIFFTEDIVKESKEETLKFAQKLKNVDGKIIGSETSHSIKSRDSKQVNFRKSIYGEDVIKEVNLVKKPVGRKSCLKRCSFSNSESQQIISKERKPRGSRFDSMSRDSIDGKIIKSDKKKKERELEASKENIKDHESNSDSQEGSHFNIFGSRRLEIPRELRENLGIKDDDTGNEEIIRKTKKDRTQSILKKNSILGISKKDKKKVSMFFSNSEECEEEPMKQRRPKKSVMFSTN